MSRSRGTFEVIVDLVAQGRTLQAAMLGRSLFEDMAVGHWLVLHRADPEWLIARFEGHVAAMRLYDADVRRRMGAPAIDDVSDLAGREGELRAEFGRHAERDWWGRDRDGNRVGMPQLVSALAAAPQFRPRLKGEEAVLEQYYAMQHKAWTQALHHTAAGMQAWTAQDGALPMAVAGPTPFLILFGNYWVFGQLIFAVLDLGAPIAASVHFEKLFLAGLAVFGEMSEMPVPWADQVGVWAAEACSTHG
jgi:hypothetical protein